MLPVKLQRIVLDCTISPLNRTNRLGVIVELNVYPVIATHLKFIVKRHVMRCTESEEMFVADIILMLNSAATSLILLHHVCPLQTITADLERGISPPEILKEVRL